jgi:archaellum component FlaC/lysophospholipase L1-like esterase
MARVVHARNTPPYLLIAFVFLFVIATVLAVLGHMGKDELEAKLIAQGNQISELRSEMNTQKDSMAKLTLRITGSQASSVEEAIKAADDAYRVVDEQGGLAVELVNLAERFQNSQSEIANLQNQIKSLNTQIEARGEGTNKLSEEHQQQLAKLNEEKAQLVEKLKAIQANHEKQLAQAEESLQALREETEKKITASERQLEELMLARQENQKIIEKLREQLTAVRVENQPGLGDVVNRADGKICKVVPAADVCYINLGANDQTKPGMTFAVYGPDSENKEDIKGRIRVTKVNNDVSECRIVQQDPSDPIVSGDVVANLAYHAARSYVFMVVGDFDLDDSGLATQQDREEIKDAIRRFGGTLGDTLDYRTDYVVMGTEPSKPEQPSPDASDATRRAYEEAMQEYKRFFDLRDTASQMQIPVLNKNRFLIFTGYMPAKKPT